MPSENAITDNITSFSNQFINELVKRQTGIWNNPFKTNQTEPMDFILIGGTKIQVPMMFKHSVMQYTAKLPGLDASSLRLPFKGRDWELMVVLPNRDDGLSSLLEALFASNKAILEKPYVEEGEVDLWLPRFKLTHPADVSVKSIFQSMGIERLFEDQKCDLSGVTTEDRLYVSDIFHKAVSELDKEGVVSAAAATTVGEILITSARRDTPIFQFRIDHPFFFILLNNEKTPVFIGYVTDSR